MAQKLVETENIEFYVLVQRLQEINSRLEQDTAKLQETKIQEDSKMENEGAGLKALRDKQKRNRERAKHMKQEWLEKKHLALQNETD